jgi:integrase
MPRQKKKDLVEFSDWLEKTRHFAPSTAYTYTSNVRRILRNLPTTITTEALDTYLEVGLPDSSRSSCMCSWRAFAEWLKGEKDMTIPVPSPRFTQRDQPSYSLPDEVCDDVSELLSASGLKATELVGLRWLHVENNPRSSRMLIEDPNNTNTFFNAPRRVLERLKTWGFDDEPAPTDPIVPDLPHSNSPMPLAPLRRILAIRRRSRHRS